MAEKHHEDAPGHAGGYDSEIDLKNIVRFGVGLVVATAIALVVMWWMSVDFKRQEEAKDRPRPPIQEALVESVPPGPRLQPAPPRDMDEMRDHDREALSTYGWADQANGVARIPLERAMSILAEKGRGAPDAGKKAPK